ncbi:hypothetical protein DVH24_023198 [Malus domestica]|uniref:Protein kinase domain-containing protein n=1 Tax=Malus domestica TaxID=3750 RepID=A0A498KRI2_MALDO|nr:hypothetical protein DVH24_023198 [Malus domestica]
MPTFRIMDDTVLKEICSHLRPMKYNCTDNIIEKGDPIQMLLIVEGRIGHQGREKGAGEIYGEELLVWPFSTSFRDRATAAKSPFVITDVVEALVLTASNMESVATEFRKHFIKNYGRFVENLSFKTFLRFFTEEEVKRATSNYTCLNNPNEEGYGTVYHTELDGRVVAIRASPLLGGVALKTCNSAIGDPFIQSQRLVHEAFVLLHISHKNVERLLGCCLETRWPIMVYDHTNALTLVEHFHRNKSKRSLESRMKIAAETAGALAHVHSRSVIHRDVKTANILIYRTLNIPIGPTLNIPIDPTIHTVKVTGLMKMKWKIKFLELLTRQEAISSNGSETSLANDFVRSVQEDRLGQILDGETNTYEFSFTMAEKVSKLAVTCLRSRGEERPSMKKVAEELEGDNNISSASRTSE